MSRISASFGRVPTFFNSQRTLSSLNRTNAELFKVQQQLASGKRVNSFSDDAAAASIIALLDDRIERSGQRLRNLDHADSTLNILDSALSEASKLSLDAQELALEQINSTFSASDRKAQAAVVESLIQSLLRVANTEASGGAVFGGSTPGRLPVEGLYGGYQFVGTGPGLITDIGLGNSVPLSLGLGPGTGGGGNPIGATATRVRGTVDLDPTITADTRLADLNGGRRLGVSLSGGGGGAIEYSVNAGQRVKVDLSGADTVGDVLDRLTASFREYEQTNGAVLLGGLGSIDGQLTVSTVPGVAIRFFDVASGTTAQDLGLTNPGSATPIVFDQTSNRGLDLDPKLSWSSPLSALNGTQGVLGSIRLRNLGQTSIVDLSQAQTLQDLKNLIEGAGLGVRVEINQQGTGIDVLNQTAAGVDQAMSISEVAGSNQTATRLGIRTFGPDTRLSDFNDGRGVRIADKGSDPITGLPDPAKDIDFTIKLGDLAGTAFSVDLRPQDLATVQTVVDRINAQAQAVGIAPADFAAGLSEDENGIVLRQGAGFAQVLTVIEQNNSQAARDLGLLDGTYDATTKTLRGQDRATVRVDNFFTALIDLRDSLLKDSTPGIGLAGQRIERMVSGLAEVRGLVGGFGSRVVAAKEREEDIGVLDQTTRSTLQDLDFTEAATRFSLLQTQLQATLQATAQTSSQTLLDYL
jgi:flagellar hook-associated protein 3 FlgL